jgi:hypothetical protein
MTNHGIILHWHCSFKPKGLKTSYHHEVVEH